MKYQLLIFDFDGTLADTFSWFVSVINDVADRFGFRKIDPADMEHLRQFDAKQMMKMYDVPLWKMPRIAKHMRDLMSEQIDHIKLFEDVDILLEKLFQKKITLGIVTSNALKNVKHILGPELMSLISHFECGVSMHGKQSKLNRVLKDSGVQKEKALFIGDEIRDLTASKKVGIDFGAVSWGYNSIESLEARQPEYNFQRMMDILVAVG